MSMYQMVFPDGNRGARGGLLLAILGGPDPGRFRDCWVERSEETGEPVIVFYTRNGGGNRECYCEDGTCTGCVGERFAEHPLCFKAPDDEFDSTYRTYYFHLPETLPDEVAEHLPERWREVFAEEAHEHVDTDQRWLDAIAIIGGGS